MGLTFIGKCQEIPESPIFLSVDHSPHNMVIMVITTIIIIILRIEQVARKCDKCGYKMLYFSFSRDNKLKTSLDLLKRVKNT